MKINGDRKYAARRLLDIPDWKLPFQNSHLGYLFLGNQSGFQSVLRVTGGKIKGYVNVMCFILFHEILRFYFALDPAIRYKLSHVQEASTNKTICHRFLFFH